MSQNLINRKAVKSFILGKLDAMRPFLKISRVSKCALDDYEAKLMAMIIKDIQCHPTMGKTFKP